MAYQTSANRNAFVMGSVKMFIPSTASGEYFNLGAARGVTITEAWESFEVETDNTPPIMIGAKNQTIEVSGNLLELNFLKLARMRSGFDSFSTTTFTFDSGGNVTITPQAFYLVHTGASSSQTVTATIYYASVTEGLSIPFPADGGTDVAEIPFTIKGVCQSTRTAGQQLYSIVDLRANIYSTDYSSPSTSLT
jgi:hypothetical protein